MGVEIREWPEQEQPDEMSIRRVFEREGLDPYRWSNSPGDVYSAHSHPYHKVLYVVRGSITFGFPDRGEEATLKAGDRLELPPGTNHDARVGPQGVACLEAHRP